MCSSSDLSLLSQSVTFILLLQELGFVTWLGVKTLVKRIEKIEDADNRSSFNDTLNYRHLFLIDRPNRFAFETETMLNHHTPISIIRATIIKVEVIC